MRTQSRDTVELPVVVPENGLVGSRELAGGPEAPRPADRRAVRDARRRARRARRLYALLGLAVLAAFLVATVVVLDMVH